MKGMKRKRRRYFFISLNLFYFAVFKKIIESKILLADAKGKVAL